MLARITFIGLLLVLLGDSLTTDVETRSGPLIVVQKTN